MKYKHLMLALVAVVALAVMPSAARADNVTFTLNPVVGAAGATVTVFGTITNGSGAITFDGSSDNLLAPFSLSGVQPYDSLVGLGSGAGTGTIALFNVLIAPGTLDGVYGPAGNQIIIGYDTVTGSFAEAAANFTITVRSQAPGVPEPTSIFLLGSGLVGVATSLRKRWKARVV